MTRRRFIFVEQAAKKLYVSPEFNGTQEEFAARVGCRDTCDLPTSELLKLFRVKNLSSFNKACEEAQGHYRSMLGKRTPSPAVELSMDQLKGIRIDELVFVIDGQLVTAPSDWNGTMVGLGQHINSAVKIMQTLLAQASDAEGTCSLEYRQTVKISNAEMNTIERYLHARREADYQSEDHTITHTARFPDGTEMDVKCCGAQDESSWTEAVLFDPSGQQIACSEVCEHYIGSWELEHDGINYAVDVTTPGNVLAVEPAQVDTDLEGICPVCGAKIEYDDAQELLDDGAVIHWECPNCGASGKEGYDLVFDRHYNVCDSSGMPVPGRE